MESIRRARVFVALAVFALLFLSIAAPQLFLMLARQRLFGTDARLARRQACRWQIFWLEVGFRAVFSVGGIRASFRLPDHPSVREGGGSFIIVSNHYGGFDGVLVGRLLTLLGRTEFCSVGKSQVARWPIIGAALRATGSAFVRRSRDPNDVAAIERCGTKASEDGVHVLIFPEGTTYDPAKAKDGLVRVLPPKSGGLRALLRAMPGSPILSVTIQWHDHRAGRARFDGILPPGSRVTVHADLVTGIDADRAARWLGEEWRRKDELLIRRS